jgi:hypothetical protein
MQVYNTAGLVHRKTLLVMMRMHAIVLLLLSSVLMTLMMPMMQTSMKVGDAFHIVWRRDIRPTGIPAIQFIGQLCIVYCNQS